jgi:hypothetical protein
MKRLWTTVAMLAAVCAAIPVALYGQSDQTDTMTGKYTIVADSKSGGVWRLNSTTGELWFCLASAAPRCHLAENSKQ